MIRSRSDAITLLIAHEPHHFDGRVEGTIRSPALVPEVSVQNRTVPGIPPTLAITSQPLPWRPEVSGHLVGSTAFKAAVAGDPCEAGSIPVHLRATVRHGTASRQGSAP